MDIKSISWNCILAFASFQQPHCEHKKDISFLHINTCNKATTARLPSLPSTLILYYHTEQQPFHYSQSQTLGGTMVPYSPNSPYSSSASFICSAVTNRAAPLTGGHMLKGCVDTDCTINRSQNHQATSYAHYQAINPPTPFYQNPSYPPAPHPGFFAPPHPLQSPPHHVQRPPCYAQSPPHQQQNPRQYTHSPPRHRQNPPHYEQMPAHGTPSSYPSGQPEPGNL